MLKNDLMVSKPLAPPWQDSNKNLTRNIISYVNNVCFHVLTPKDYTFNKDNVISEDIYQPTGDYAQEIQQNIQALFHLITVNKQIDMFHFVHTPNPQKSLVLKHLTKFKNIPSIHTIIKTPESYYDIKNLLFADKIVTLSDYNKQKLKEAGVQNISRIYPGLDLKEIDNYDPYALEFRNEHNLLKNFLILFAGDSEYSGVNKSVLECIPPIVSKYHNAKFIFACRKKTEDSKDVESELKQNVIDLGIEKYFIFLSQVDDMLKVIRSIDICIFPIGPQTNRVDIPLLLLECMAYAKPVVISDLPPLNEVFLDDIGYKVNPEDRDSLIKALLELLESNSLRFEKGYKARQIVEKYFNIKILAKEYENLYAGLLKI